MANRAASRQKLIGQVAGLLVNRRQKRKGLATVGTQRMGPGKAATRGPNGFSPVNLKRDAGGMTYRPGR